MIPTYEENTCYGTQVVNIHDQNEIIRHIVQLIVEQFLTIFSNSVEYNGTQGEEVTRPWTLSVFLQFWLILSRLSDPEILAIVRSNKEDDFDKIALLEAVSSMANCIDARACCQAN